MANRQKLSDYFGPGFVVAATGIGAGDMIASSVAGAEFGVVILWAILVGGVIKFLINEGIARWQVASQTTLLEGWVQRLPRAVSFYFVGYLFLWAVVVAATLISFAALAMQELLPLPFGERNAIAIWGAVQSVLALVLVRMGGYRLFERVMQVFVFLLFVIVIYSALQTQPDWILVLKSLVVPTIPRTENSFVLLLSMIGGVGGSVTLLCYAYWLRAADWSGKSDIRRIRWDLGAAYLLTALFGVGMVLISAKLNPASTKGYQLIRSLSDGLLPITGALGAWLFIAGFWGASFSSMLGVWQGIPYLYADFRMSFRTRNTGVESDKSDLIHTNHYRNFQYYLALLPLLLVYFGKPTWIGLVYSFTGALFMPFLAMLLLFMNNKSEWVQRHKNGWLMNVFLVLIMVIYLILFLKNWMG